MSTEDLNTMIRRNMLLGMWAAKKLGLEGESADAYADDLARGTLDFERSDVLKKLREDFKAAGIEQSDEDILQVMNELWLRAAGQTQTSRTDATDAASIQLARNLLLK